MKRITKKEMLELYKDAVWLGLPEEIREESLEEDKRVELLMKHASVVLLLMSGNAEIVDSLSDPADEDEDEDEDLDDLDDLDEDELSPAH